MRKTLPSRVQKYRREGEGFSGEGAAEAFLGLYGMVHFFDFIDMIEGIDFIDSL